MPGRDRYSPDEPPTAIAGVAEVIYPGNVEGDDDNWKIDVSSGDWVISKKVSGTWEETQTIKGS